MCGSDELIHDARQVDLEEMIMTNETPMYLVPGRLTDEQDTAIRREMIDGPVLDPADMFVRLVGIVGTPIQPCADVETVGYGREASFSDLKGDGCHGVSIHKEWDGGIPLVRRTDMEAQVATWQQRYERIRWRFLQDAKLEGRALTAEQFDTLVDGDDEARAALNEGAAG